MRGMLSQRRLLKQDLAFFYRLRAEDGPCQIRASRANEPREPHDFALPDIQRDVLHARAAGYVSHLQGHLSGRSVTDREDLSQRPPHHLHNELALRDRSHIMCGDRAPIAHHGRTVANPKYLLQPVGDVDYRQTFVLQRLHEMKQLFQLPVGQDRGRLVHNHYPGLERKRLDDLHHLLLRQGQFPYQAARFDSLMEPGQPVTADLHHFYTVEETHAPTGLASQKNVLRHG